MSLKKIMLAGCAILTLAGCTMTAQNNAEPLPSLMAQFAEPYYVNAARVVIESRYDPLANPKDVSGTFPSPPDVAIKQYAENRFKAAGGQGEFRFVILDASVFQTGMRSDVEMARWMGVDNKDRYTAVIRLALYRDDSLYGGPGAPGAELKAERTITMPANISLDERDNRIQKFMVQVLKDVDTAATNSIANTLKLSTPEPAPSPGPMPVEPVQITPVIPDLN